MGDDEAIQLFSSNCRIHRSLGHAPGHWNVYFAPANKQSSSRTQVSCVPSHLLCFIAKIWRRLGAAKRSLRLSWEGSSIALHLHRLQFSVTVLDSWHRNAHMPFFTRSVIGASVLVCLVFLLLAAPGTAIPSSQCLEHVKQSQQSTGRLWLNSCRRPICGSLDTNNNLSAFMDRLSDSCRRIMSTYSDPSMSRKLMARIQEEEAHSIISFPYAPSWFTERSHSFQRCSTSPEASFATNPVVVESNGDHAANFAMCTVPKAGCTLLRSLLFALTRDNSRPVSFRSSAVHSAKYPTVWHYHPKSDFPDTYPTFVIGRNPYIRLVSGFLDKMVVTAPSSHDWVVMQRVNQDLHRHKNDVFEATPESFREFVLLMTQATKRNQHFDTAVDVCGMSQFPYRYVSSLQQLLQHPWIYICDHSDACG